VTKPLLLGGLALLVASILLVGAVCNGEEWPGVDE